MTASRKPAPTSARRLVMMAPPCNSACERQVWEKNSVRCVRRKTWRKYFGGGIVLGSFCNGRWETLGSVRFLSRGVYAPYRTHCSSGRVGSSHALGLSSLWCTMPTTPQPKRFEPWCAHRHRPAEQWVTRRPYWKTLWRLSTGSRKNASCRQ